MATGDSRLEEFLSVASRAHPAPQDFGPGDLGRASIESFIGSRADSRDLRSSGHLRLSGAGVLGHAADLDGVGNFAVIWQRCVTATGAALEGAKSAFGRVSQDLVDRTQLLLDAAPAPGSLILLIEPKASPAAESYPNDEKSLFGDDPRPLADRAMETLLVLLGRAAAPPADSLDDLSVAFRELGPRVATSIKVLMDSIVRAHVDLYADWREPEHATVRLTLSASSAGWISAFVKGRDLDAEDVSLRGVVRTVSDIAKWSIQLASDEIVSIDAGSLSDDIVHIINVGARVSLIAQLRQTERPDGAIRRSLTAKSLRLIPDDEDLNGTD